MTLNSNRHDFNNKTKEILAKRAGCLCSICSILTVGPSLESIVSITNIGVAAHITAASPGGPRYDSSLTNSARSNISNGIWLCQNHAALIDRDCKSWTVPRLNETKTSHEEKVLKGLTISTNLYKQSIRNLDEKSSQQIAPKEYGFLAVKALIEPYKQFITPILQDKGLNNNSTLGVLMCESKLAGKRKKRGEPSWTVFVNDDWLRWILKGQSSGFKSAKDIPNEFVYGQIPGWPDSFFEFLEAIIQTNTTFEWKRHTKGYLTLEQKL